MEGDEEMEVIANKIVNYLDIDELNWNDLDRMQMVLGMQILIHNIIMISAILLTAKISGILGESIILLTAYGILKITAGGIHFKKSLACLLGTGCFIFAGVCISRQLHIHLAYITLTYAVCMMIIAIVGPQGTKNNPILADDYEKLRKRAVFITFFYFLITLFFAIFYEKTLYLLVVAVVFETFSLIPAFIKNCCS